MSRLSTLRSQAGIAVGGVMVGFVGTALISSIASSGLAGPPAEPVVGRAYMTALLNQDRAGLARVEPQQGITARAKRIQSAPSSVNFKPTALSYVGGGELNGVGVYVYVAEVRSLDGTQSDHVPFTLTIQNGKVVSVQ